MELNKWVIGGGVAVGALLLLSRGSSASTTQNVGTDPGVISVQLAAIDAGANANAAGAGLAAIIAEQSGNVSVARTNTQTALYGLVHSDGANYINLMDSINSGVNNNPAAVLDKLNARTFGGDFTEYAKSSATVAAEMISGSNALSLESLKGGVTKYMTKSNNATSVALAKEQTAQININAEAQKNIASTQADASIWNNLIGSVGNTLDTATTTVGSTINSGQQMVGQVIGGVTGGSGGGSGGGGLMGIFSSLLGLFGG